MKRGGQRTVFALVAALAVVVSFAVGYSMRNAGRIELAAYTGSGYVGADQASLHVGDTWYGFKSSVAWTDRSGSEHQGGWPDCLPKLRAVVGVRFGGAVVMHSGVGEALVLWVDCRTWRDARLAKHRPFLK